MKKDDYIERESFIKCIDRLVFMKKCKNHDDEAKFKFLRVQSLQSNEDRAHFRKLQISHHISASSIRCIYRDAN